MTYSERDLVGVFFEPITACLFTTSEKSAPRRPSITIPSYCNNSTTIVMTELQELQAQLRELNIRLAGVKKDEKQAYLADVQERVALYGITEDELLRAAGFRKSRKPRAQTKYYDPASGKQWSGFGPRPKWLEGKNLDDYLIERAAKRWWPGEET